MRIEVVGAAGVTRTTSAIASTDASTNVSTLSVAHAASRAGALMARAMPRGATWALELAHGREVHCIEGTLWITQDTHPQDHVLEGGESWAVPQHSHPRVLVHALRDARVHVRAGSGGFALELN